jgi:predicted phage terminase large subunit-like protein
MFEYAPAPEAKNIVSFQDSYGLFIDGKFVRGSIPQDPGQAGKAQSTYLIRQLAGYAYTASPETGDKETRAQPLAAQAEVGNVKLVQGPWVREFLDEISTFPVGKWKDQVDAASRAFNELVKNEPIKKIKVIR